MTDTIELLVQMQNNIIIKAEFQNESHQIT